jgi:hypothetical protein
MKLNISINIDTEDEKEGSFLSRSLLNLLFGNPVAPWAENIQVSLTREGDRSGGNLLLPRLEGRVGNHLQSRKAKLKEVLD